MENLSAVIITKNEEHNIGRCLESLNWVDEIVVIDTGSTDRTVEICKNYNCKVIEIGWQGFGNAKRYAVNSAKYDWIMSIDSDEEVTPELRKTIMNIFSTGPEFIGYKIKRESYYLNRLIRHSGWGREYKVRLFNRKFGNFSDDPLHESVILNGETGVIEDPLIHHAYPNIQSHIKKMDFYAHLSSDTLTKIGKKASVVDALLHGVAKFFKMYFLQAGFLDGIAGFLLALNSAYGVYLKYIYLWEKKR